jgi:hypothetical protein
MIKMIKIYYIVIFLVSLIIAIGAMFIIYYIISEVETERTKILGSFYKIPTFYVKWLSEKCGKYVNKVQVKFIII